MNLQSTVYYVSEGGMHGAGNESYNGMVTLIFYRMDSDRAKEPLLNRIAAYATKSEFTHVEMAIGSELSHQGLMRNVVRIFNDKTGVEVTERTGINPSFSYMSIACTKRAELAMLAFSRKQVGKPFSMWGMALSVIWPRKSTGKSWFCAELVGAVLQAGDVIEASYNPGGATPESIYRRFHGKFATAANPYVLNQIARSRLPASAPGAFETHMKMAAVPNKARGRVVAYNGWMKPLSEQPGTVYALSPWKLSADQRAGSPEELEPLVHNRNCACYRCMRSNGSASGSATPCGGAHVDTAAAIRNAVARAGVLNRTEEYSLGGMYDHV